MPAEPIVPIRPTTEDPAAVNFVEALGGRPRAKGPAAPAPAVEPLLVDTGRYHGAWALKSCSRAAHTCYAHRAVPATSFP